jgi:Ser-tRNA(Ala) deacylase AlaX
MATDLLYLKEFNVVMATAKVQAIRETEDGRSDIQLDSTCFYPRGGGQDWDEGNIQTSDASFHVEEVRLDADGIVHHIGSFTNGHFEIGEVVQCEVDKERRFVNTRLHSAAHVVDLAVDRLNLPWIPAKGAHYPHMSFVEYEGETASEETETIRHRIEQVANEVV